MTCDRYDCAALNLPPHTHLQVPHQPGHVNHRWAATHRETPDIDRIHIDWRAVAYETWTGQPLQPDGQLTLALNEEATR